VSRPESRPRELRPHAAALHPGGLLTGALLPGALFVAALLLGATPADEARWQAAQTRIDRFAVAEMRRLHAPGLALAITDRDRVLRVATYGYADLEAKLPVRPDHLFEIGSISKSFTAIALLQEHEAGRFDPHAPITDYLPWFEVRSKYAPITGHDLLTHSAGLPDSQNDIPSSLYTVFDLRHHITGSPPGAHYSYSNVGFQTLGAALEAIAGMPYADIIRKRIFEPLGMTRTEATITHDLRRRLAVGYQPLYDDRPDSPGAPLARATWLEYALGDGSISSTPADLAAYVRMLLNRGAGPRGRLLSAASFDLLTQKGIRDEGDIYYGYGLRIWDEAGHHLVGHTGGMVGYCSRIIADLDSGLGVVVFVNGPETPSRVAAYALDVARAARAGKAIPDEPPSREPPAMPAGDYAGTYTSPDGRSIVVTAAGGAISMRRGERAAGGGRRMALEPVDDDQFRVDDPEFALYLLRFGRDPDKKVVEAFFGPDWYAGDRYAGPRTFEVPEEWTTYPGHYRSVDPWLSNFRIVLRKGALAFIAPDGGERTMTPLRGGEFRLDDEQSAERLRFDSPIDGKTLRALLSEEPYYRTFTP